MMSRNGVPSSSSFFSESDTLLAPSRTPPATVSPTEPLASATGFIIDEKVSFAGAITSFSFAITQLPVSSSPLMVGPRGLCPPLLVADLSSGGAAVCGLPVFLHVEFLSGRLAVSNILHATLP